MKKFMLFWINYYQIYISPRRGPTCKFHPTCSKYAKDAIEIHGAFYGGYLATKRFFKCHPLRKFTIDEVPPKRK